MLDEIQVQVHNMTLRGIHWRNDDTSAKTVLAIHGWLDNCASFEPLIETMPECNWIALDLTGHGHSDHRPPGTYYHFIDWVYELKTLLESGQLGNIDAVVGHSLGGLLLSCLAGVYPELISKLVVIDAAGLVTQNEDKPVAEIRQALDSRSKSLVSDIRQRSFESIVAVRMQAGDLPELAARLLMTRNVNTNDSELRWRTDPRLRTGSPIKLSFAQARSIIQSIEAKVLICKAENGYQMVQQGLEKFRDDYTHLIEVEVEGGHHCHMTHPQQVANAIRAFIS